MSSDLCTAAFVVPVTTELALVARRIRGVGCASNDTRIVWLPMANPLPKDAHVYGAFNFAVGIGASGKSDQFIHAQAGPNICFMDYFFCVAQWARYSAEKYDHYYFPFRCVLISLLSPKIFQRLSQGWMILNLVAVAIIIAASVVVFLFTGGRPLARRLKESGPSMTCKSTTSGA